MNRLVTGLPGLESAAPVEALESLASDVHQEPDWIAWLAQPAADAAAALRRREAPAALGARLEEFLGRWGHRGVSEGELRASSWDDDPAPLLAALRARAASPRPPGFRARAAEQLGRADETALRARLGPLRALLLHRTISGAREWVTLRETTKSLAIALVDHGRDIARAAARRLVAAGRLAQEDDVFFLSADALRTALLGSAPSPAALRRRRRRWDAESALPAPREVDLGAREAVRPAEGELRGLGVSAGVGLGNARVIQPGEVARLEPGEVLVAPVLDAALGPLLAWACRASST